jgi:hypothetical protein
LKALLYYRINVLSENRNGMGKWMPYQGNTKSPRVLTKKRTNSFTFQKNPPAPDRMDNFCEMNQVKSFQESKASSTLTVDHQTDLNADSSWLEHLAKQHRFESDRTASDRVLVPYEKLPESHRIDGIGLPIVLDSEGKNLGDHGSGEEKWGLGHEQKGSVASQGDTRMTGQGNIPQ